MTAQEYLASLAPGAGPHRSKYGNRVTMVDGERFPSALEARRWSQLRLLAHAQAITELRRYPRFDFVVNGQHICSYIGDFAYTEKGRAVVEDTKGFATREFIIKRALLRALYPEIDFREIKS